MGKLQEVIKFRVGSEEHRRHLDMPNDGEFYEAFAITREPVYDDPIIGEDNFIWYRLVTK